MSGQKLSIVICLIAGLFAAGAGRAASRADGICEDLFKLSAAPGTYDDGTGIESIDGSPNGRALQAAERAWQSSKAKFKKAMNGLDDESVSFRRSLLAATGLSVAPQCDGADIKPNDRCSTDLAEGASELAMKILMPPTNYSNAPDSSAPLNPFANLSDVDFVLQQDKFKQIVSDVGGEIRNATTDKATESKIREAIFPQIKALLLAKIDAMISDPEIKLLLTDKVKAIKFKGTDCSAIGANDQTIGGSFYENAFADPVSHGFYFCQGLSSRLKSDFPIAFIVGHELAHAVDPCRIAIGPTDFTFHYKARRASGPFEKQYPFKNIISCLRSSESAHAAKFTPAYAYGYGGLPVPPSQTGSSPSTAQPPEAPKFDVAGFCQNDQIAESFADWMSVEILPDFIASAHPNLTKEQLRTGYSNVMRPVAQNPEPPPGGFDPHPSATRRTNFIVLAQPNIRAQIGCPPIFPGHVHCDVNSVGPGDSGFRANPFSSISNPPARIDPALSQGAQQ